MPGIRIAIAEDHHLVRKGLIALLALIEGMEVVREAADGQELLAWFRAGHDADVALLDLEMPHLDGIAAASALREMCPGVRCILLTMQQDVQRIRQAAAAGFSGFLFKTASVEELGKAIRLVHAGKPYYTGEIAALLLHAPQPPAAHLSARELEVLRLIAQGYSSTEIGGRLFISPRTVDTHRNNLIQKLEVNGIAGLIRYALEHRLA